MLDEHLASLPEDRHRPEISGDSGDYMFGSDDFDEFIDARFGGRSRDLPPNHLEGSSGDCMTHDNSDMGIIGEKAPFDFDSIFE